MSVLLTTAQQLHAALTIGGNHKIIALLTFATLSSPIKILWLKSGRVKMKRVKMMSAFCLKKVIVSP